MLRYSLILIAAVILSIVLMQADQKNTSKTKNQTIKKELPDSSGSSFINSKTKF